MSTVIDGIKGQTLATWTTATRPASPIQGQAGFNTTLGVIEVYTGTAWQLVANRPTFTATYLIVAGGAGGGGNRGGGGGAGGYLAGTTTFTTQNTYTITVGAAGTAGTPAVVASLHTIIDISFLNPFGIW